MPPVFAHGALRLYLLSLLESGPKHGYELIKALKDRFGGTYSPSAGTVYPRLGKLEEDGLVATEPAGRRTNYRITAAGLAELNRRREDLAGVENDIAASVQRLSGTLKEDIRSSMRGFRSDLAAAAEAARAAAASATTPPGSGQPQARRGQPLREAELLLQDFRDELRADLRRQATHRPISPATLETVRTALDEARAAIRGTLQP
ncbi:PadR family transcriptional regulator [Pseudarthrobacter sp. LT1]|jgi:DNA-binding PadR family transcriptional regulator|uniref:PadR family transcriptional regulator n=1 Tax=Pseudarthrobacter sp. LT1 TaxID=3111450 RepID=UPI002D778FCA|nr:PadR family transcriptional regulator [Pseudarthrobacter sp. LT1]WRT12433.1 PadR family transcriptional regulator [Pseudarthrobacter sp. LT1]